MNVGFIGLGNMGLGVARSILGAGHRVKVWNRRKEPVEALVREGATAAKHPGDAFDANFTFSMLSSDTVIEDVIIDSGALDRARPGLVHVNLSTVSVAFAERLERLHVERGLGYVSATVLGRPNVAAVGQLDVMCAGAPDAVAKVEPLLDLFAKRVWPVGDTAAHANVVKISCNLCLASMIETLGEAGALVEAYGVLRSRFYEILTNSLFAAPAYKTYAKLIEEQSYEPAGFRMPLGLKDVRLALQAGEAENVPLPIASLLRDAFIEAIAAGDAEKDWAALAAGAFRRAGRTLADCP